MRSFALAATLLLVCPATRAASQESGVSIQVEPRDASGSVPAHMLLSDDICTWAILPPQIAFPAGSAELVPCARGALDDDIAIMKQ